MRVVVPLLFAPTVRFAGEKLQVVSFGSPEHWKDALALRLAFVDTVNCNVPLEPFAIVSVCAPAVKVKSGGAATVTVTATDLLGLK